jgi:predicted O-linked N-acetylglucosamine transferase (SPINDLY family)
MVYKITPDVFALWLDLLRAEPKAVLWLLNGPDPAAANLKREASRAGIDPSRIVFAPRRPLDEHLARLGHADLFLDTYPCTAHTTASDAVLAGLPVLTRRGETFASRVAASILSEIGCPELVAHDAAAYRETAMRLMQDRELLARVGEKVRAARTASRLFDTPGYARDLEAVYREMHRRRVHGLPPAHIDLSGAP